MTPSTALVVSPMLRRAFGSSRLRFAGSSSGSDVAPKRRGEGKRPATGRGIESGEVRPSPSKEHTGFGPLNGSPLRAAGAHARLQGTDLMHPGRAGRLFAIVGVDPFTWSSLLAGLADTDKRAAAGSA